MELEELRTRAKGRLAKLSAQPNDGLDAYQRDALAFFARVPEPPLYRRRDDPTRALAATLLEEAETLLARAWRLGDQVKTFPPAIEAHALSLALMAEGKVEPAEPLWHEALAKERTATAPLRLWSRTDEKRPAVFESDTRRSRFDPRPEAQVDAKMACPLCHKVSGFSLSPRVATHVLQCLKCSSQFTAYVAELRALEVKHLAKNRRRYHFHVEELSGLQSRVAFDDSNPGELSAARRDLIAFLYDPSTALRGVLNLNTSRVLWVNAPGMCFVATVAFGDTAPETQSLRAFRDRVLMRSIGGRAFVDAYYAFGPSLAKQVGRFERLKRATRSVLRAAIPVLEKLE
ncbi:MAG: hypothetical protein QM817_02720 [Archangium sp.]